MKSQKNKIKAKSQIILIAVLVAVALILINYLSARHFFRIDMTEDQEYTLSDSTKNILKKLDDQVVIKLYFTKKVPPNIKPLTEQVLDLLNEYKAYSDGKVSIKRMSPDESPEMEQETQMLGIPPLQLNVVQKDKAEVLKVYLGMAVFYGDKREVIPVLADVKNMEYDITSSLLKLTTQKVPELGLIVASQTDYEFLEKVLEKQVKVKKLEYVAKDLDKQNVDMVMLVGPKDVSVDFKKGLTALVEKGTPVIILLDQVEVEQNLQAGTYSTGFEDWLKEYGVQMKPQLLIEPRYPGRAAFSSGIVQYQIPYPFFVKVPQQGLSQTSPITAKLEELVFPWANTLELDSKAHPDKTYTILAKSSDASFLQEGEPLIYPQALENVEIQPGESHVIAALIEGIQTDAKRLRLIVVANTDFVRNNFLQDFEHNILLVQNMIDWVSWGDDLIGIRSRGSTTRPIDIPSSGVITLIRLIHILGLPLMIIGIGFLIAFLRRQGHKKLSQQFLE